MDIQHKKIPSVIYLQASDNDTLHHRKIVPSHLHFTKRDRF